MSGGIVRRGTWVKPVADAPKEICDRFSRYGLKVVGIEQGRVVLRDYRDGEVFDVPRRQVERAWET